MRSFFNLLLLLTFLIVLPGSLSYAQEAPESTVVTKSDSTLGIKIISPPNDKRVPEGSLTILGTSTDTENMNCTVYVDWNNLKPFQKAKATGPYGKDDFSSWAFTYSSSYHDIKNGTNNLTSKLECQEGSVLTTKWNSINVTGVRTEEPRLLNSVSKDSVGSVKILPQLSSHVNQVVVNDTSKKFFKPAASQQEPVINTMHTNVKLANPIVAVGNSQGMVVKAVDAKSFRQISGANVQIRMTDGIKNIEHPGVTDSNGVYNYSWPIDPNSKPGSYKVAADVSAAGYRPIINQANFQIQGHLLAQVNLAKGIVKPGDSQAITVNVLDAITKQKVSDANVSGIISGSKKFRTATNANGQAAYSWIISPISGGKSYNVTLDVSHDKYSSLSKSVIFKTGKPMNLLGPSDEDNLASKLKMHSTPVTDKEQCKEPSSNGQSICNENSLFPESKGLVAFKESSSAPIFG
jgi:hypothetical protein